MQVNRLAIITLFLLGIAASFVFAATNPTGPGTLNQEWSERNTPYAPRTINALAGNITELTIASLTQTRTWQGYVGNVSGTITLDDASNNTLYDWSNAEPRGQIYATNKSTTPQWENISCFNYSSNNQYNLSALEASLGLDPTEVDGVDETFKYGTHDTFYVGSTEITTNTCNSTYMYQNDGAQTANFQEVLLTDTTAGSIIYAALLENRTPGATNDLQGFNGIRYDFQMLVGDNGHGTDTATTTYWFYVELI